MRRTIKSLNEMSFELPSDWEVTEDRYKLSNGQGFINKENYLSKGGKVISLFEVHRQPSEFLSHYQNLVEEYNKVTDFYKLEKQLTLKFGEYQFPTYIIKCSKDRPMYIVQVFVDCGDALACFIINIDKYFENPKDIIQNNEAFSGLVKILRTVQ